MTKQQLIDNENNNAKRFPKYYTGRCEFPKQPKSQGRKWEMGKIHFTEEEVLDCVIAKPIADGHGYYVVTKIPNKGKDPILTLTHVEIDGDNYGADEDFTRLSQVFFQIERNRRFGDKF